METLLLACFGVLAALGVGAVMLLDRRFQRLHERLARLDDIEALGERVRGLSTELHRKELNERLATRLSELGEAQRRVTAALNEVQQKLVELGTLAEQRAQVAPPSAPAPEDLGLRLRRHLAGRGFEQVSLLSDLGPGQGGSGKVVFEARRDGVLHKGHLELADGEVVSEQVRSAYTAFP